MSLIEFRQTPTMNTFLAGMSRFAKADIFNGEEFYEKYLALKETIALNAQFEFYGSETLLALTNSGSFFVI
jgi:hypothetical protein